MARPKKDNADYLTYKEQLNTKEWRRKRVEILIRDSCKCYLCGYVGSRLNIHHFKYINGLKAWEYPNELLYTLCLGCHTKVHKPDLKQKRMINTSIKNIIKSRKTIIHG